MRFALSLRRISSSGGMDCCDWGVIGWNVWVHWREASHARVVVKAMGSRGASLIILGSTCMIWVWLKTSPKCQRSNFSVPSKVVKKSNSCSIPCLAWCAKAHWPHGHLSTTSSAFKSAVSCWCQQLHTLWLRQNSYWKWPFIGDFPIRNGDFP